MKKRYVQVIKSTFYTSWYAKRLGEVFSVSPNEQNGWLVTENELYILKKDDCVFVKVDEFFGDDEIFPPEPSPEELAIMNQSALELEAQFVGE